MAVLVVGALLCAAAPGAGASEWDTRDATTTAGVQNSYPYKTADPSQNDPLGFPYRSAASYAAWYLADSGVRINAEMPGADGPAPVRFASSGWGAFRFGDAAWTASMWRLGFRVRDDSKARQGDLYVDPEGQWVGVVHESKGGWVTVAGYEVGDEPVADGFGIVKVRVAKGDCACVIDVFNTPIESSQGGVTVTKETTQDKIRTFPSAYATEVSPPMVDASGTMSGRVSTDGEAFVAWGEGTPGVSFPEGGPFDVADQDPAATFAHHYRHVLYNRTFGNELAYLPGGNGEPGTNGVPNGTQNFAMSPNLDFMGWSTHEAMLPEDSCPDGSPLANMVYEGQGTATTLTRLAVTDNVIYALSAGGLHVNAQPVLTGGVSPHPGTHATGGPVMLCVGPERTVNARDMYVTDLHSGDSFIATPPQLNSDPAAGQESYVGGIAAVSDPGIMLASGEFRASYGYPESNPNDRLPSPLRGRGQQAMNLIVGGAQGWFQDYVLNLTGAVIGSNAAVREGLDDLSVDIGMSWPSPINFSSTCQMVEWLLWRCTGPLSATLKNKGPFVGATGTYDVADPAGTWGELQTPSDAGAEELPAVLATATGDVRRPDPPVGSLASLVGASQTRITPNGRWWHNTWWFNGFYDGSGVCLESVASGARYDCRAMTDGWPLGDGSVGPNDDGEFLAVYRTPGGDVVAVWAPGSSGKLEMRSAAYLPQVSDEGGTWGVCHLDGVSMRTAVGRRTLGTFCRGSQRRFAILEVPDLPRRTERASLAGGSGAKRGQGVVAGGGRWEVGTRAVSDHGGDLNGARGGLVGVAVKRDTGEAAPSGAAFYELSTPSRRWRVLGRKWDALGVDVAPLGYRLERPGSAAVLEGPCDVYSVPNTGGKQPFVADPPVDRRGTYCTWRFVEGSGSGHGGDARFSLVVRRANGGPVVLDVPETEIPLGPSNQLMVDAAGYDKPLSALGRRMERAAKNLAAGLVDDLADDVAGIEVEYEVQEMMARLDPWLDHQLEALKGVALEWLDRLEPWLEEHVFTPIAEMATKFVARWDVNFDFVHDDVRNLFEEPLNALQDFCDRFSGAAGSASETLTAMFGNPYVSRALALAGFDTSQQAVVEALITSIPNTVEDICGSLGQQAQAALDGLLSSYVDGPLASLVALFESLKTAVTTQITTAANGLRDLVGGWIDNLRSAIEDFDLTPLKDVAIDTSSCPGTGEAGYDPNCRIDAVREWAREILKSAHDWLLDLVYEEDPNYDYSNPSGCEDATRLMKMMHCAVEDAHDVWTEGFTSLLGQVDAGIQGAAAGISAITTDDSHDRLFHCVVGLGTAWWHPLGTLGWFLEVLGEVTGWATRTTISMVGGWIGWFSGAEDEVDPLQIPLPREPHLTECFQPTPGGWEPDDADWLPLGPWSTEQVSRFFYAALDFGANVLADQLSRVTVDGGDVNAVGHAVVQLLVNLSKRTITLDGQPVPDNYAGALEEKLSGAANDVGWDEIWGFLTDGVDGFLGAGMSDWGSIQSGMRCAEVSYNGQWWYDHAPWYVRAAHNFEAYLEGCRRGGFVQGTLSHLLEDAGQFLGQPLAERFEYLWENPLGIGARLHELMGRWEKRLVSLVQSLLPDWLRDLAGWIRSAGMDQRGEIETGLRNEVALLMDLLQGEAGAANPVEAAVRGAADRVVGALDTLAWSLEVGGAQPWLREVAQLVRWANARLADAVSGVAGVVQAVHDWVAGLGLPDGLEGAIFGLLDQIMGAVTDAAQWVHDNALEPAEAQLDALLRMAFGSIADAIRAMRPAVYDLRDSLIGKFRAWLVEWADKVARACGEGHAKLADEPVGVCDIVAEPVDTIFDAGVEWIAGAIDDVADVIENRVSGAPRTIRAYVDDLNCELVLYVYDIAARTGGMCERVNAGLPPFEVKKSSESLLNTLTSKGEELQGWILDELAKAARTIRGFDLESEDLWAQMDATVASGMQFALFAVDPAVRAALGEYLRHGLSRVARWVEPMSDEQALRALGEDLGLPDLYRVIQDQVAAVVPFVKAQVYHVLGNLPNVDGLAFDLRASTSLADVVNAFGSFGDYLLSWVLDTVEGITGNVLDLNARVAGAIGDSVLRVAENTLRAAIQGVVNVFKFVVWAHEYTFEKVMTPLVAMGEVPDLWAYPGFGEAQVEATYGGDVRLELAFAREPGADHAGAAVAAFPDAATPGGWYVVSASAFQSGELTQPDLTLEVLDGNTGIFAGTGFCNVYRASGPQIADATVLVSSGDCTWDVDGLAHTFALTGPLPGGVGTQVPLVSGTDPVLLGRPTNAAKTAATVLAQQVAASEAAVAAIPPGDEPATEPGDATPPELASAATDGGPGDGWSWDAGGVSPDGRYVVFASDATNLVAADANGNTGDVFLRDRATGSTIALSTTPAGDTASDWSEEPTMSGDGTVVAFTSWAPDLVAGDTNSAGDVFVRDLASGVTERASVPAGGGEADGESTTPALSRDGRYVAFYSEASNLVPGDTNGAPDIFVADRTAHTVERVSVATDGSDLTDCCWLSPSAVSDDGNRVVFEGDGAVYLRTMSAGTTTRVDVNDNGDPASGTGQWSYQVGSRNASISGDGRYVAFQSWGTNLAGAGEAPDTNVKLDVFRRDLLLGRTRIVSRAAPGVQADNHSGWAGQTDVSRDGRWVVFNSMATNLTGAGGNGRQAVYARDMDTGDVRLLSVTPAGSPGNGDSWESGLIGENLTVVFPSLAADLVPGDANDAPDVFVSDALAPRPATLLATLLAWVASAGVDYLGDLEDRDANDPAERWVEDNLGFRGRLSPEGASVRPDGGFTGQGQVYQVGGVSPDGRYVVFAGDPKDMLPGVVSHVMNVLLRDRFTGTTAALSTTPSGELGSSGVSYFPAMSGDGTVVAFVSYAGDLVPGDTNGRSEVFVRDLSSGATERVVRALGGGEADDSSASPVLSGDGRYVGFVSRAGNLVGGDANGALDAFVLDRVTGVVERVSLGVGGGELTGGISDNPPLYTWPGGPAIGMSDDGGRVVFVYQGGVYVRDRALGTTRRVDVADGGSPANGTSARATISGDGRYVVFASAGTNLAGSGEAPDTNGRVDVFRHDLERGRTRIVSRPAGGAQSDGESGSAPVPGVSRDGRWVVFDSTASNMTGTPGDGQPQMYARDMLTGRVKLLSADPSGTPQGRNLRAVVGGDGTVAVASTGALDPADGNSGNDAYVSDALVPFETWLGSRLSWWLEGKDDDLADLEARRDREDTRRGLMGELADAAVDALAGFVGKGSDTGAGGGPVLVNVTPWGAVENLGDGDLHDRPRSSGDGRFVVFTSGAADLVVGDGNDTDDVFRRDTVSGVTVRVSENVATGGEAPEDKESRFPAVSGDGRYVAYRTEAPNLTAPGATAVVSSGVLVWDAVTGANTLVPGSEGATGDVAISADGRWAVYGREGDNDENARWVYRYDRVGDVTAVVNVPVSGDTPDSFTTSLGVSDDGRHVMFVTDATNMHVGDDGGWVTDALVRDMDAGVTTSVGPDADYTELSGDGRYVVFDSWDDLVAEDTNGEKDVYRAEVGVGVPVLVSVASDGALGTKWSHRPSVSRDGNLVVFLSSAANLAPGTGSNGAVLVRDVTAGVTRLVNVDVEGRALPGWQATETPSMSGDGSRVVFAWDYGGAYLLYSATTNPPPPPGELSVQDARDMLSGFVAAWLGGRSAEQQAAIAANAEELLDRLLGSLAPMFSENGVLADPVLVSASGAGDAANRDVAEAQVSPDGAASVFTSRADNLVAGDTNSRDDVFVSDNAAPGAERVSVATDGTEADDSSANGSASNGASRVAFASDATNLVAGDTNARRDVFVRDRTAGTTVRVSVAGGGTQADGSSYDPEISPDGRYVVFSSDATNLVGGDTNGVRDVFLHDIDTGVTERVSVHSVGAQGIGASGAKTRNNAVVGDDGKCVAFTSDATNLVTGDTNAARDVFVRDRVAGTTTRVSVATDGTQANGSVPTSTYGGSVLSISGDCWYLVFLSDATNLVAGDTNAKTDAFSRELWDGGVTNRMSVGRGGTQGDQSVTAVSVDYDWYYVGFVTRSDMGDATDTNGLADVYVKDPWDAQGTNRAGIGWGGREPNAAATSVSLAYQTAVIASTATNLAQTPPYSRSQAFFVTTLPKDVEVPHDMAAFLSGALDVVEGWTTDSLAATEDPGVLRGLIAAVRELQRRYGSADGVDWVRRRAAGEKVVRDFLGELADIWGADPGDPAQAVLDALERVQGWLGESPAGLEAAYYAGSSPLGTPVAEGVDAGVDFAWGAGGPAGLTDDFSVSWRGRVVAPVTGAVEFTVESDDGARLWVDGRRVLDDWSAPGAGSASATVDLVAGLPVPLRLEYRETSGSAAVSLRWRLPGAATGVVVPASALLAGEPRVGDLPRTITGLERFGDTAAVVMGRANTDVARGVGAPADSLTALLVATAPYDDPQGSLAYGYRDGSDQVTVATTGLDTVTATGSGITVTGTCTRLRVPLVTGPLAPPVKEGPLPCTWRVYDDAGTTRLDVSAAGVTGAAVLPDWRLTVKYPT